VYVTVAVNFKWNVTTIAKLLVRGLLQRAGWTIQWSAFVTDVHLGLFSEWGKNLVTLPNDKFYMHILVDWYACDKMQTITAMSQSSSSSSSPLNTEVTSLFNQCCWSLFFFLFWYSLSNLLDGRATSQKLDGDNVLYYKSSITPPRIVRFCSKLVHSLSTWHAMYYTVSPKNCAYMYIHVHSFIWSRGQSSRTRSQARSVT